MKNDNIQVGLRIPEKQNAYLEQKARKIGIPKNALINTLIEFGLKIYDGEITISLHPKNVQN